LVYHSVNSTGQQYAALTYDAKWVDHYIEDDLARVDPVVKGCFQRFHPVDWKRLDWSSKKARDFMGEAVAEGIGNQGFSVPIRGPNGQFALFSVNQKSDDDAWEKFTERNIQDLILVAHYLNETALRIERGTDEMAIRALSTRERCLNNACARVQSCTGGGKPVGQVLSVSSHHALALLRLDRVQAAFDAGEPIESAGVQLDLHKPAWAHFELPMKGAA